MNAVRHTGLILLPALLLCAPVRFVSGQPLQLGITWATPDDVMQATRDLRDIYESGFRAVRLAGMGSPEVYALADSLGLALYQDLPVRAPTVADLADTLAFAREVLADVLEMSSRYGSPKAVGLADLADTSDPAACVYFAELVRALRSAGPWNISTYYTTRFVKEDRCSSEVDEVLVDLLDLDVPDVNAFAQGVGEAGTAIGVAALGTWTDLEIENRGLRYPRSPESQARYLEMALGALRAAGDRLDVVFVHRWRDPATIEDVFGDLVQRRYGLHNSSGGRRPAFDVATGFATGTQEVFAFDRGTRQPKGWMWMTLLGWSVLAALGLAYATSPRMRHMVPRYFLSHAFYREAVISGRESLVAESIALLGSISVGVGMLVAILLKEISFSAVFEVGRMWMSAEVRDFAGALLDQPWMLTLVLASAFALTAVAWTSVLSLLSRSRQTLLPAQAMMLVIWPQWSLIGLLLVSPALATVEDAFRLEVVGATFAVAVALSLAATGRTLLDFWRCSRVSPGLVLAGLILHPVSVGLVAAFVITSRHAAAVEYLWHLVTRL